MNPDKLETLKYPTGKYSKPNEVSPEKIQLWIRIIEEFPSALEALVKELDARELEYNYRPGGWTIKQVVHHCADSHMNSLIRFKLALTEDLPTIKPYFEERWAELADYENPISDSLIILKGVHHRWVALLKSLDQEQLKRDFIHPEHQKRFTLKETMALYAWHCQHHLAHIEQALEFKNVF